VLSRRSRRARAANSSDNQTAALWTDARNGRGSGDPTSTEPGRNPICEQSDVFFDRYSSNGGGKKHADENGAKADSSMIVAPCPPGIKDKKQH
jgi:hypothetical protein